MTSLKIKTKNFVWRQLLKYIVNPNKIVNTYGGRMFLDSKDSLLLSIRKNYEPDHVNLMKEKVKSGDYVIDIGANIGYYTLLLAKLVGPDGKVFAFEPDPENFRVLEKNVKLNGYKNIIIENKAVTNENGKVNLFMSNINKGDTKIYQTPEEMREGGKSDYEVDSIKLDDYFNENKEQIKFFKMDIQGVEPLAIMGMMSILKNYGLDFTVEFSPDLLSAAGLNPKDFLELLNKNGFCIFDLDRGVEISHNDFDELIKHYEKINYFTTLYCSKQIEDSLNHGNTKREVKQDGNK